MPYGSINAPISPLASIFFLLDRSWAVSYIADAIWIFHFFRGGVAMKDNKRCENCHWFRERQYEVNFGVAGWSSDVLGEGLPTTSVFVGRCHFNPPSQSGFAPTERCYFCSKFEAAESLDKEETK
jgi:hypothetical protein